MESGKVFEPRRPGLGQVEPHDAVVLVVPQAVHEPCCFGPVHEADNTVVAQEQVIGDLTNGRGGLVAVAPYGQEQLVLGGGQAGRPGLAFAPALEMAEPSTQCQQASVSGVR